MGRTFHNATLRVEYSNMDGWEWFLYSGDNPHNLPRRTNAKLLDAGTGYSAQDCLNRGEWAAHQFRHAK